MMNFRSFYVGFLICLFAVNDFAQTKPVWLINFEDSIKQKESPWRINQESRERGNYCFVYLVVLKSDNQYLSIKIVKFDDSAIAKKSSVDLINVFRKIFDKHTTEIKLKDIGDECYFWKSKNDNWVKVAIRKDVFFIDMNVPSEAIAKRFAHHILKQIPNN